MKFRDLFPTPFDPSLFLPAPLLPRHFQKEPTKFQYLSMLIAFLLAKIRASIRVVRLYQLEHTSMVYFLRWTLLYLLALIELIIAL